MKLYLLIVPFVALVAALLANSYYAMPAALSTLHGTLGAITNATAGIIASGRALKASEHTGDEWDAADLMEALELIEENANILSSAALVCTEVASNVQASTSHRKDGQDAADSLEGTILSAKGGMDAVLDARKVNWGKVAKKIGLCAACGGCLVNNRYGSNCAQLCHDCKHCCSSVG